MERPAIAGKASLWRGGGANVKQSEDKAETSGLRRRLVLSGQAADRALVLVIAGGRFTLWSVNVWAVSRNRVV